jgi:hypothetical protein
LQGSATASPPQRTRMRRIVNNPTVLLNGWQKVELAWV